MEHQTEEVDIDSHLHEKVKVDLLDTAMEMRRQMNDATSAFALTVGIPSKVPDVANPTLIAHLFGGSYDCWVVSYNKTHRTFLGYCSFGGPNDQDAEF